MDDEGYTCARRLHDGLFRWVIVDRRGRTVDGEKTHASSDSARRRADEMNDDAIARRLADSIARRR